MLYEISLHYTNSSLRRVIETYSGITNLVTFRNMTLCNATIEDYEDNVVLLITLLTTSKRSFTRWQVGNLTTAKVGVSPRAILNYH